MPSFAIHFSIHSNAGPNPGLNPRQSGNLSLVCDDDEQARSTALAFLGCARQMNRLAGFVYTEHDIVLASPREFEPGEQEPGSSTAWQSWDTRPHAERISVHLHDRQGRTYCRYTTPAAAYLATGLQPAAAQHERMHS